MLNNDEDTGGDFKRLWRTCPTPQSSLQPLIWKFVVKTRLLNMPSPPVSYPLWDCNIIQVLFVIIQVLFVEN